jgi:peptidoglycan hydrolase-like amidase
VAEPPVKIGLYKAENEVQFISDFAYEVFSGSELQGTLFGGEVAKMRYSGGNYYFNSPNLNFTTTNFVRLVPYDMNHYFTLKDYERFVSWKGSKNFNVYRGVMEFKYSPKTDVAWVVNELPMDLYIAGIAETSNGAAMEYIKAILTAARTYAYYHLYAGVPADQRTFDLYATTVDQLYLGYNSEVLMPRVVQAARATYGEMVTYNNNVIVTPYFGNSDGQTRTWKQVWGGTDKPWLIPVVCVYDQGKKLFGHGVGMSAWDASQRADKDGWTYDQLLRYYYTGVQVEKIY